MRTTITNVLFLLASFIFIFLCIKGGWFGYIGEYPVELSVPTVFEKSFSIPSGRFIILFTITWIMSLVVFLLYPRDLSAWKSRTFILGMAMVCRLALLPHEPSDDINRYLWEGKLLNAGINPYLHAPDDEALQYLAKNDPYHPHINHPYNPAAYPPFIIYLFSLSAAAFYSPFTIKLIMILFDMGTIIFLVMLLDSRGLDRRWSFLYSINPVILYSFAGQGHFDAVQNFFLIGALFFYDRKRWPWMFIFAGLAIQSKYVAVVALPFLINRENIKYAWIAFTAVIIPYLPMIGPGWKHLFYCIIRFGEEYAFNGSVHAVLRVAFGDIQPATMVCKYLLGVSLLFGFWYFHPDRNGRYKNDPISGCFFSMGALLIFAPTIHFWYLSWIIPLLVFRPAASWIILCLTISGYFVTNGIYHHTGEWRLPVWAHIFEWFPFYLFFLYEIYLFFQRLRIPAWHRRPESISVVIPVKNEAGTITRCISEIKKDSIVSEIIVVDGNSSDQTISLAHQAGARVVMHPAHPDKGGGRGGQIYRGIMETSGDVVAVVHADTSVSAPVFTKLLDILSKNPTIAGGAVGSRFDSSDWQFRVLEIANDFRAVFLGISFGDQVQFFRRDPVVLNNIFPNIPLMEDVEFSIRLHRLGRHIFLFGDAHVSSRRWKKEGYGNSLSIVRRMIFYLLQRVFGKPDTVAMYRSYYN